MIRKTISKDDFQSFVDKLIAESPVWGVTRKGRHFTFDRLQTVGNLCLGSDYVRTLLPAKKFCFPQQETLVRFVMGENPALSAVVEAAPAVVVGLHPCDLHSLQMLDLSMGGDRPDANWQAKREALTLIGVDCRPDEHCFCTSMHTNLPPSGGYDLFLTDIQDKYVIDVGSDRGSELLSRAPGVEDAVNGDLEAVLAFRQEKEAAVELHLNVRPENLPLALTARRNSKLWGEKAEKCLACGSCNTTCATCFCFDVLDRMNLSLADGVRERQWDGCLLPDFAMVGHGENFRSKGEARYRHRFYRKFDYLPVRYGGVAFCCGCGRCSVNCLADIANPVAVLNQVAEETAG